MDTQQIPKRYADAVATLARWHGATGSASVRIYAYHGSDETVRLLEVGPGFAATGHVVAIVFGKSPEFPYRSAVIQISTDEFRQLESGELALPPDWRDLPREEIAVSPAVAAQ